MLEVTTPPWPIQPPRSRQPGGNAATRYHFCKTWLNLCWHSDRKVHRTTFQCSAPGSFVENYNKIMQSFGWTHLTVSSLSKNAEWNPKQHLWALCWASLIQKAFITEHAEEEKKTLMSLNLEVQTLGEIQTFFSFLNTEIKGLYAGFYLINKSFAQNILALCVFNDP